MPSWRWTLTDSVTSQTYQVGTNPHEGGSPTLKKSVAKSNTSAGSPLLMEGQDEAQQASVSGVLLDRATYDAFVDWMTRPRPVAVADDLGRTFSVIFTEFTPKREPRRHFPWRHTYQARYIVVGP